MLQFSHKFTEENVTVEGVDLFFRHAVTPSSSLVLLIHGHTQTSDMWAPLANRLNAEGYSVIAADLPGLGRSNAPDGPFEKKDQAKVLWSLVSQISSDHDRLHIVGHDLGAFVAYAFAAQFAEPSDTLTLMDATVPGIGIWPMLLTQPRTWHFGFFGPFAERIIEGRERTYLDRFWDEFAFDPAAITEDMRVHYALFYERQGGLRQALSQFTSFQTDAEDNQKLASSPLKIPVLGLGGEHSLGPMLADHLGLLASDFKTETVMGAGHWLLEEQTDQTIAFICDFISAPI